MSDNPIEPQPWADKTCAGCHGPLRQRHGPPVYCLSCAAKRNTTTSRKPSAITQSLQELSGWMRYHLGPSDGVHEMLVRAVEALEAAGYGPQDVTGDASRHGGWQTYIKSNGQRIERKDER